MSKQYEADDLLGVQINIIIPAIKHIEGGSSPIEHYAGEFRAAAKAAKDGELVRKVRDNGYLGAAKDRAWTKKEIYIYLRDNIGVPVANKYKKLHKDWINVDPSQ